MKIPHHISTLTKVYTSVKEKLKAIYNSFFYLRIRTFAVGEQRRRDGTAVAAAKIQIKKNVPPLGDTLHKQTITYYGTTKNHTLSPHKDVRSE